MIHLLIIAEENVAIPPIAASSASVEFKSLRRANLAAARPLLEAGMFDVCLLAVDKLAGDTHWIISEFHSVAPLCPLVVMPKEGSPDEERAAYVAGADLVLAPSCDQGTFVAVIQRLAARNVRPAPVISPSASRSPFAPAAGTPAAVASSALAVMRDFSQVFSYSLDYKQFTGHFVLKLREVIGATRIAIFLEPPPPTASVGIPAKHDPQRLVCAGAVGLPADLIDCFELSRKSGLGQCISQSGRILHLGSESTAPFLAEDPRLQREFEILGCEIALPVNDRERTIGVALLGGRLTGTPFSDSELMLVCHLLEELGLAVKNSWLHHQLSVSHRLFSDVLDSITSGALVIGPDLSVLFANQAMLRHLRGGTPAATRIEFADLPQPLAKSLHEVVERGQSVTPFLYDAPGTPPKVFRASLIAFPNGGRRLPQPALLLLEDFTQVRAAQQAEIEASNLKLIGLIARRFAHEIRNSLVPLTTHQQFLDTDYGNAEFRDSLKHALSRETSRIQRFTEQMIFLAQTDQAITDTLSLEDLLRKSFTRSREFLGVAGGELEIKSDVLNPAVRCHRPSMLHALQEIFLNGLQSAGEPPKVSVTVSAERGQDGRQEFAVRVRDNGRGFSPEVAIRAIDPFFTTRNTGVGLGLTVAKRVIEAHAGRLEVCVRNEPNDPDLIIHLPSIS